MRRKIWHKQHSLGFGRVRLRRGLTVRVESPQDNLFEDDRYQAGASPQILQKVESNQMNLVMKTKRGFGGGSYDDAAGKF